MAKTLKNITVSLEEDLARWVRVWSAQHDKSVSRMIADLLAEKQRLTQSYEQAQQSYLKRRRKRLSSAKPYPSRDELYD